MREIKFRCWDKKRKQMYDVIGMSRYYSDKSMQPSWIGKLHKKMTPTGRTKEEWNGREIYEGDIVKKLTDGFKLWNETKEPIGEVFYENGCFCVGRKLKVALGSVECEVIGNVYENPELLKEGVKNER